MTDQNLTEIVCIVDRSGSMASIQDDVIGGFNRFLEDQKKVPGKASMTYVQFDDKYEIVHNGKPIQDVPALTSETYKPRGQTALLDAIGKTMNDVGTRLSKMPEEKRPGKVIAVVLTDGKENASREFTQSMVKQMIEHQRDTYKWEFVFLAANQDAFASAQAIGVAHSMNFAPTGTGVRKAYDSYSRSVTGYRSSGHIDDVDLKDDSKQSPN